MVQRLIYGFQVQNNLNIMLYKTKVKYYKLDNWIGSVPCMATKVNEYSGVANGNKNQGHGGNRRRILVV